MASYSDMSILVPFFFHASMGNLLSKGLGWLCFDSWRIVMSFVALKMMFLGACIQSLWTEMSFAWLCHKLLHVLISCTVVASFPCVKTRAS